MKQYCVFCVAFVLLAVARLGAQTSFSAATAGTSTYLFSPYSTFPPSAAASHITYSVSARGSFTYDFSSAGDTTLQITLSAPTGQMFVINALSSGWATTLTAAFSGGGSGAGTPFYDSTGADMTVSFTDLTGAFSAVTGSAYLSNGTPSSNSFSLSATSTLAANSEVTFTSITFSEVISADFNGTFSADPIGTYSLVASASQSANVSDPGSTWFTLAAVPEPSTYAVIAGLLGLGLAVCRRLRVRTQG